MNLSDYRKEILKKMAKGERAVIVKGRRCGLRTFEAEIKEQHRIMKSKQKEQGK